MYEYICKNCGKRVEVRLKTDIHAFCGRDCYIVSLHKRGKTDDPVAQPGDRVRDIHPDGYDALVAAIIQRARDDVLHYKPGSWIREDAENFFLSKYFEQLTELDGFEILYKLSQIYEEQHRKNRRNTPDGHGK